LGLLEVALQLKSLLDGEAFLVISLIALFVSLCTDSALPAIVYFSTILSAIISCSLHFFFCTADVPPPVVPNPTEAPTPSFSQQLTDHKSSPQES
jgi:hypothetical protein